MTFRPLIALLLTLLPLAACSESSDRHRVGVGVSGVNYTDQSFGGYAVREPGAEKSSAGGEPLGPYSAGGVMCCYNLPKEWHEGLQVELVIRRGLKSTTSEGRSREFAERKKNGTVNDYIRVDVPRYDNADNATLWVEMLPEDQYKVVVSDVDPNHEDWPGDIKGWPVPSDEYRNKLILEKIESNEGVIRSFEQGIKDQEGTPDQIEDYKRHIKNIKKENDELRELLK
ncbi:DUF3304 domain-containing protein [Kushneria sp. Sum13]|uniref:DUF3304 domain-containing protein n=1 Tax=Kushneria sp. Sum13 TaxID=3459196 RepID=UPI0040452DFC